MVDELPPEPTPAPEDTVTLRWTYTPQDFIPPSFEAKYDDDYELKYGDGTLTVTIAGDVYDSDPELGERIGNDVAFMLNMLQLGRSEAHTLNGPAVARWTPNPNGGGTGRQTFGPKALLLGRCR